jgi:23S rRNA pseudouridine1911/1915/1917 synthase
VKQYLAVVCGTPRPPEGIITLPLRHDPSDRRRIITDPSGTPSETRYRVRSTGDGYSLVECVLVTGRTHQIRVHLAARGWPIAGDGTYGSPDASIDRQALHAWRFEMFHPATHELLRMEAPMPADMRRLCMKT